MTDMSQSYIELERRVIAAERELRSIRAVLAEKTRCTCHPGWGNLPAPNCPKHGNRP